MQDSLISWTTHTFNPWEGCTKVSPGCAHCYAETRNQRFSNGINWGKGALRRRLSPVTWNMPVKWNREAQATGIRPRVFCASLADWLDDEVPIEWLADLLELIRLTPNLDWLLLSKRPQNWATRLLAVRHHLNGTPDSNLAFFWLLEWISGNAPSNVWLGTTVEDQVRADERIPLLLGIPAKVRFLSCEPLLGPLNLNSNLGGTRWMGGQRGHDSMHHGTGAPDCPRELHHHHDERCSKGIDWVICGGESGPKARPMHPDWARSLRDQCINAQVAFHFKQWGEWAPDLPIGNGSPKLLRSDGRWSQYSGCYHLQHQIEGLIGHGIHPMARPGKKAAGRLLDGREWNEMPSSSIQNPTSKIPSP